MRFERNMKKEFLTFDFYIRRIKKIRTSIPKPKFEILAESCFVFSMKFCSKFVQNEVIYTNFLSHLAVHPKIS
jgi:hypothetical protein